MHSPASYWAWSITPGAATTAPASLQSSVTTRGYAQTDWRVRPNLTLNLGLRYEIGVPRHTDPVGAFTSFDPNIVDPRSGLKGATAFLGDCNGCNGQTRFGNIDYSAVGPRLGAAYSLGQKTVIRAGYGIYYAAGNGLMGGFCLFCANGFSGSAAVSKGSVTSAALNWDNGFVPPPNFIAPPVINPSVSNAASDVYYINPRSGTAPRFQNWSLSIQRELPPEVRGRDRLHRQSRHAPVGQSLLA